jgi:hypothetical protein
VFPGLQFSAHGRRAVARAALPGWGWPTMADGMQRVFRAAVVVLGLGGAIAGCAPPPLTSGTLEGSPSTSYFYGVMAWAEERDSALIARTLPNVMKNRGDNYTQKILSNMQGSGGACSQSGVQYRCTLDGSRGSNDCFRGMCSRVSRTWGITISWRDAPGPVEPTVNVNLKVTRSSGS